MGWRLASEPPDDGRDVALLEAGGRQWVGRFSRHSVWTLKVRRVNGSTYVPTKAEITHWRELPPPPSDRPTVRVRVAVAVMPDGTWNASGSTHCGDDDSADDVMFYDAQARARLTWIEADIPLPEPIPVETIEGEVTS